jgi:A/G-specific adenine glycosylase
MSAMHHLYPELLSPADARPLQRRLLTWFRKHQRDLPWRLNRDPYRIWVSEIMLQQTQVAAVVPYFERFLQAFPDLPTLAAAPEQAVLQLWEGLGYYRRARDLHRAARQAVAAHGGQVPGEFALLRQLPGIGRYTAGAILSQAFEQRLPIIEANSTRVLCRWFACADDPRTGQVQRWLWRTAERLLPRKHVGAFNQAVMELGALICTPRRPRCEACPVAEFCAARAQGLQETIPRKAQAVATTEVPESAVVLRRGPRVLLVQRPADARRWANFWEFPHGELRPNEPPRRGAARLLRTLTGVQADLGEELTVVRHGITRFLIRMHCFEARYQSGRFRSAFYQRGLWISPADLSRYPLSVPQRRLAKSLRTD